MLQLLGGLRPPDFLPGLRAPWTSLMDFHPPESQSSLCPPNNPVRLMSLLINIAALRNFRHTKTQKKRLASGGFAPWHPEQGLCPWTSLGAQSPDPRYRLELCARHVPIYGHQSELLDPPLLLVGWEGDTSPNAPPPRRLDSIAYVTSYANCNTKAKISHTGTKITNK